MIVTSERPAKFELKAGHKLKFVGAATCTATVDRFDFENKYLDTTDITDGVTLTRGEYLQDCTIIVTVSAGELDYVIKDDTFPSEIDSLAERPTAAAFGKGDLLIANANYRIKCTSDSVSWDSHGYSDSITNRPLASVLGKGSWQVNVDAKTYLSDGLSYSQSDFAKLQPAPMSLPKFEIAKYINNSFLAESFEAAPTQAGFTLTGGGRALTYTTAAQIDAENGYGVHPANGPTAMYTGNATLAASMNANGFSMGFSIGRSILDSSVIPTSRQYLVSNGITGFPQYFAKEATTAHFILNFDPATPNTFNVKLAKYGKPSSVPVVIVGDATNVYLYIDSLLVCKKPRVALTQSDASMAKWYFGGYIETNDYYTRSGTGNVNNARINSAFVLDKRFGDLSATSNLTSVGFIGTSLYAAAGPADYFSHADNTIAWYPGNGFNSDATTPSTPIATIDLNNYASADTGVICQIFRELAKGGYYPASNTDNNRAVSGGLIEVSNITSCINQVDNFGTIPQLVFVNAGTNEVAQGVAVATFETSLKRLMYKLSTKGIKYAVIQEILPVGNNPTYAGATYTNAVIAFNAVINDLIAWGEINLPTMTIGVDRVYSKFGGATPDSTLFRTNDLHPNSAGSALLGISAGQAAVNLLSNGYTYTN